MFANAEVKDYTIQLDGKPTTIKKERWLGIVNRKDGVDTDTDLHIDKPVYAIHLADVRE